MKNIGYIIATAVLVVLGIGLLYEGWPVLLRFIDRIGRFKWVGAGIVAWALYHRFIEKNRDWFETFTHELTHAIVAVLFLREITSFQANQREGVIWSRGPLWCEAFVALAPYCLPIFTYVMLFIWSLVASRSLVSTEALWGLDILVGLTLCHHFFCFHSQTGSYQPDLQKFPLFFSYTYIWFFRLFNLLVVVLCYLPSRATGHPLKLWGAFWYLAQNLWKDALALF